MKIKTTISGNYNEEYDLYKCTIKTEENEKLFLHAGLSKITWCLWFSTSLTSTAIQAVVKHHYNSFSGALIYITNSNFRSNSNSIKNEQTFFHILTFVDMDECSFSEFLCQHECVNQPGSYYCFCPSGYVLVEDTRCQGKNLPFILSFKYN